MRVYINFSYVALKKHQFKQTSCTVSEDIYEFTRDSLVEWRKEKEKQTTLEYEVLKVERKEKKTTDRMERKRLAVETMHLCAKKMHLYICKLFFFSFLRNYSKRKVKNKQMMCILHTTHASH